MPIEKSCERYKNALVFALPTYGFGWCRKFTGSPRFRPGEPIEPPMPFHLRITEFRYHLGDVKAFIGCVEEISHPLNKAWLACCVRDGGGASFHDFTTHPAEYNIGIGMTVPAVNIDPENLAMPEWIQFGAESHLSGLGYIVDSSASLEEVIERNKK